MMTVLTACVDDDGREPLLTKQITLDAQGEYRRQSYDKAYRFDVTTLELDSFDNMAVALQLLEAMPRSCVIRGELIPGKRDTGVRRKKDDPDPSTVFFRQNPCGVRWLMLDFDSIRCPAELTAPEDRLNYLVYHLPPEFHEASFYYQWSASAGLDDVLKAHVWFWLSEPWLDEHLKGKAVTEGWPIDTAVLDPIQVHYTAAPVFIDCSDPIAVRSGVIRKGCDEVELTEWVREPPPRRDPSLPRPTPTQRFEALLDAIGNPKLHEACRSATAHYVAMHGGSCDTSELKQIVAQRIWASGRSQSDKRRAEADLNNLIKTALRKYG